MTTLIVFAVLAAGAGSLLHRDARRADEKRRHRLIMAHPLVVTLSADFARMQEQIGRAVPPAMSRAARGMAAMAPAMEKLAHALEDLRPCRWCRVLAAVGLSHHAAHYRPRHRAATR